MKILKWIGIILGILFIAGFAWFKYMTYETKKASPESTISFQNENLEMSLTYCRPYKKGREIFGGLVPYGEVWRTGANEATTFSTSRNISFGGEDLAAGEYTLWTIPEKNEWSIILNTKAYGWGVNWDGLVMREAEYDVLLVQSPVKTVDEIEEQFTIRFTEKGDLVFAWDDVSCTVEIN